MQCHKEDIACQLQAARGSAAINTPDCRNGVVERIVGHTNRPAPGVRWRVVSGHCSPAPQRACFDDEQVAAAQPVNVDIRP